MGTREKGGPAEVAFNANLRETPKERGRNAEGSRVKRENALSVHAGEAGSGPTSFAARSLLVSLRPLSCAGSASLSKFRRFFLGLFEGSRRYRAPCRLTWSRDRYRDAQTFFTCPQSVSAADGNAFFLFLSGRHVIRTRVCAAGLAGSAAGRTSARASRDSRATGVKVTSPANVLSILLAALLQKK